MQSLYYAFYRNCEFIYTSCILMYIFNLFFRKRCQRKDTEHSPRKRTRLLLKGARVNDSVRKALLFHHVLLSEIKSRVKSKDVKNICVGKVIRKYRFGNQVCKELKISKPRTNRRKNKQHVKEKVRRMVNSIKEFLERDDNTKIAPGKKDTITRCKIKKQKRYLADTFVNLHSKYVKETGSNFSYSLFCRLRPFWVCAPQEKNRDTCMCIIHTNAKLKAEKLKQLGIMKESNLDKIVKQLCCRSTGTNNRKDCMFRNCKNCYNQKFDTEPYEDGPTFYYEWKQITEDRKVLKGGETVRASLKITTKVKVPCEKSMLFEIFLESLNKRVCKHLFCMTHQFQTLQKKKKELASSEAAIHIDFSENFNCKHAEQVQSAHFGASHHQVSLHTGVMYTATEVIPFCSISGNVRHDPSAIWAHLSPVLQLIREDKPQIEDLHFISDGPTTQYRNRRNLYLFSSEIRETGFVKATWNFTEAGHGKGAADGVGGALKRKADSLVNMGSDISDAVTFFQTLKKETTMKLFFIRDESIEAFDQKVPVAANDIPAVKGIMQVKQVLTSRNMRKHEILTRDLSCFCNGTDFCSCHSPKMFNFNRSPSQHPVKTTDRNEMEMITGNDKVSLESNIYHAYDAGTWVIITWEDDWYPGEIIENEIENQTIKVKVMHSVGDNKFIWPTKDDILSYEYDKVIQSIPPATNITKRLYKIDDEIYNELC